LILKQYFDLVDHVSILAKPTVVPQTGWSLSSHISV